MDGMKLVFRLHGVGFSLPVEDLVEIREKDADRLDRSAADPGIHLLGTVAHRGDTILVRDLHSRMALPLPASHEPLPLLVLVGAAGPWAGLVEEVRGIFPAKEFLPRPVPFLLSRPKRQPFGWLDIWRDEPLVACSSEGLENAWSGPC